MTGPEQLQQLKAALASSLIRKRKAGITMAAGMLAQDLQRAEVRALLEEIAKNDPISNVREATQAVIKADDARHHPAPAAPPDYVFGAKCTYCHTITYLDKRKVCPKQGTIDREVTIRDGKEVDAISVTCEHCGKEFKTFVSCEGYK